MKKILLITIILLFPVFLKAQNSLKLITPNEGEYRNLSYMMIDTNIESDTYNQLFVRKGVLIRMNINIFYQNPIPLETYYDVSSIDSSYDSVKIAFNNIIEKFGDFTFKRYSLIANDSIFLTNPFLILDFSTYNLYDSLIHYLYKVPGIELAIIANAPNKLYYVPSDDGMKQNIRMSNILNNKPDGGGLWITENNGSNWTQNNNGLNSFDIKFIKKVGNYLFLATYNGRELYYSSNNGLTWNEVQYKDASGKVVKPRYTSIYAPDLNNIYISAHDSPGLLKLSLDISNNFNLSQVTSPSGYIDFIDKGFTESGIEYLLVGALYAKPNSLDPNPPRGLYKVKKSDFSSYQRIFKEDSDFGILDKEGISFTSAIIYNDMIFVGTKNNFIYKSTDNGNTWTNIILNKLNKHINDLKNISGTFFAATNAGLFISSGDGTTWNSIPSNNNNKKIINTKVNSISINGSDIYIGTQNYGIFKSNMSDLTTWISINEVIGTSIVNPSCNNITAIEINSSKIFAGAFGNYEKVRADMHKLGLNWNLYLLQCPMAWEITKGRKEGENKIVLANQLADYSSDTPSDYYYIDKDFYHSEIMNNYLFNGDYNSDKGDALYDAFSKIDRKLSEMPKGHGLNCISMAIAGADNATTTDPVRSNPMVGTAPNVNGVSLYGFKMWAKNLEKVNPLIPNSPLKMAFQFGETQAYRCDAYDFDIDGLHNFSITMPDVLSVSEGNDGERGQVISHGIVHFMCAGNQEDTPVHRDEKETPLTWSSDNTFLVYADTLGFELYDYELREQRLRYGYYDYKPICVGSSIDGRQVDLDGILGQRGKVTHKINPGDQFNSLSWIQSGVFKESFQGDYNYASGINKFSTSLNSDFRLENKANAMIDVVVPGYMVTSAGENNFGYNLYGYGTSVAAPQAAGIAGLMLSVNKFMGQDTIHTHPTSIISRIEPSSPQTVQRRVYDIMTFTADKIIDDENNLCDDCTKPYGMSFNYVEQSKNGPNFNSKGDNLRRWWAPRMGFGRVNAYRCVAHSIANKGENEYTSTLELPFALDNGTTPADLRGYVNEEGKKLLHFGSKVKIVESTEKYYELDRNLIDRDVFVYHSWGNFEISLYPDNNKVYDILNYKDDYISNPGVGGVSIPYPKNNYIKYNNQGVTELNNENIAISLNVPDECILAIDGILVSPNLTNPNATNAHDIHTSGNTGKILTSGYLDNVTLKGLLKVSDLIISSSTEKDLLFFNFGNLDSISEVYGKLVITDKAKININTQIVNNDTTFGYLYFQPGSELALEGDYDFEIPAGTKVIMKSGSTLSSSINRKVIVSDGAELIIDNNSKVDVKCDITVQDGGKLTIKEDGEIISKFNIKVENNAQLILEAGAKILPYQEIRAEGTGYIYDLNGIGTVELINNTLAIDNSVYSDKRTVILNDIKINSGSHLIVNNTNDNTRIHLDLGYIISDINTSIIFHKGSDIRLFSENYNIKGSLIIGDNNPAKTYITGFSGKHPYICYQNNVEYYPQIICLSSVYSLIPNYTKTFKMINSEFNNVFFKVINMSSKSVDNCKFIGNSKSTKDINKYRFSFINFTNTTYYDLGEGTANISGCNFIDINPSPGYEKDVAEYPIPHFYGIYLQNCGIVAIDNTNSYNYKFSNLNAGFTTSLCGIVTINGLNFDKCYVGSSDFGSSNNVCKNSYSTTRIGSEFDQSKPWKVFNNTYNETQYGIQLFFNSKNYISSNYFNNYFNAVNNNLCETWFTGDAVPYYPSNRYKFGRNQFNMPPASWNSNVFFNSTFGFPNYQGDIGLEGDNSSRTSKVYIHCGKNDMSYNSRYHFVSRNYCSNPINPDFNDFNDLPSDNIRYNFPFSSLISPNSNISIHEDRIMDCAHDFIETVNVCTPIPIIYPCGYFVHNVGNRPEETDSSLVENYFWDAYQDFCQGSLSCECMQTRLMDAMQGATLGINNQVKLTLLMNCLKAKDNNRLTLDCLPTYILSMLGEAQERLGLLDSAKVTYNKILNEFPGSVDTTLARWRIMFIDAQLSDTTFGEKYDSLMIVASQRYLKDIGKIDTCHSCGGQAKSPSFEEANKNNNPSLDAEIVDLKQNFPNPFSEKTTIEFTLKQEAQVKLDIHDRLGNKIKEIINEKLSKGTYTYSFSTEGLASDMYLTILTFDGKQISKKMQIVK